jgi:hypothetical protein
MKEKEAALMPQVLPNKNLLHQKIQKVHPIELS